MRTAIAVLAGWMLWQAGGIPGPREFQYERDLSVPKAGPACAVLDGSVYAHAEPELRDVRLFAAGAAVPYALTLSETPAVDDAAAVLNEGTRDGHVVFDLQMPNRPYSQVRLDVDAVNFLASAKVTGLRSLVDAQPVLLGEFTLFDLSAQKLGRNTILKLGESSFPILHVDLAVTGATGATEQGNASMVRGADVPASREAQTLYTTVMMSGAILQRGKRSVVEFEIPAHLPVERVSFQLANGDATNFSRAVTVSAKPAGADNDIEKLHGGISRVRLKEAGKDLRQEQLSVPATLGANAQRGARVEIAVENGDDRPLALASVSLEMRQRKICFDAQPGGQTMSYGQEGLAAPVYDYAQTYRAGEVSQTATLGQEQRNASYSPVIEKKPFTERHPELLWVALLVMVGALGLVAFRSATKFK